jgi:hypothetical protein
MWSSLRVCEKRQELKEGVRSLVRGSLLWILTLKHRYSLKVVYDYYFKLLQNFKLAGSRRQTIDQLKVSV